jgi:NADPH:quinone reductase-like Zn-dependent oxidoreductase
MRAIAIENFGGREVIKKMDLPRPKPRHDEVLVQIKAAGVNPVDWKIREGLLQGRLPHQFPIILGWDAAGVVQEVGTEIKNFKIGDEVFAYCRKDRIHDGAYAEYIVLTPNHLSLRPKNLSWEEAAAVPLAALTAYQVLFESLMLKKNERILIHAGAGGVGGFAIQLAREAGAVVLSTASTTHHDYVRSLGSAEVIDYGKQNFIEIILKKYPGGIDAVFDTVGGETQIKSLQVLKKGGRLTTLLAIQDEVQKQTCYKIGYVFVRPDSSHLKIIAKLFEEGKMKVQLAAVLPLEQAAKAHEMIETGHTAGKIVLQI